MNGVLITLSVNYIVQPISIANSHLQCIQCKILQH